MPKKLRGQVKVPTSFVSAPYKSRTLSYPLPSLSKVCFTAVSLTRRPGCCMMPDMVRKFQDLERFTNEDIQAAIKRNQPEELEFVPIIVALAYPDRPAAEAVCIALCSHQNNRVRGHAIMSMGHLARRFHALNESLVKPVVERAILDSDEYVRVHAKSAADEIHQFLHWNIAGHEYG